MIDFPHQPIVKSINAKRNIIQKAILVLRQTDPLKKAYKPFKNQLTFQVFKTKVEALNKKKWNFVRASFLYQQALKCGKCDPNVAALLLCSSADAMQLVGKRSSWRNFEKFYKTYCPSGSRNSPIKHYPSLKPPLVLKNASFDESLDYIYANFRCLYTHEGIGRLELPPKGINLVGSELLDKFKGKYYIIDSLSVLNWFELITKESLYKIL
jgi:hypothetical protein